MSFVQNKCRSLKKCFRAVVEKCRAEIYSTESSLTIEFTNERDSKKTVVPSIAITEATASANTTRSTTPAAIIISIPVMNNSNENLIIDDNQNNNGSISTADLENIENNNASDYIQNRNEIRVSLTPSPSTISSSDSAEDLILSKSISSCQQAEIPFNNLEQQINYNRKNVEINQHNIEQTENEIYSIQDITIHKILSPGFQAHADQNFSIKEKQKYFCIQELCDEFANNGQYENHSHCLLNQTPCFKITCDCSSSQENEALNNGKQYQMCIDQKLDELIKTKNKVLEQDSVSIKSLSSEKSNEISSVEEALRALDSAIEGGYDDQSFNEICCEDYEEGINKNIYNASVNSVENGNNALISSNNQLTRNKSNYDEHNGTDTNTYANHFVASHIPETRCIETCKLNEPNEFLMRKSLNECNEGKLGENSFVESVRIEAEKLIDRVFDERKLIIEHQATEFVNSILNESQRIIEHNFVKNALNNNVTGSITLKSMYNANDMQPTETSDLKTEAPINPNELHQRGTVIFNCNKKQTHFLKQLHTEVSKILTDFQVKSPSYEDFLVNEMLDMSSSTPCAQSKYADNNILNVNLHGKKLKFHEKNDNNISVCAETPRTNTIFNTIKTVNNPAIKHLFSDTYSYETINTYPGDPCTSKQALERDQFLEPLIKFHRDEVTSEDLNTITPLNTPIEPNYNLEIWEKMTKPNNEDSKTGCSAQLSDSTKEEVTNFYVNDENVCGIGGTNFDQTFDFDDEEDSENLESTFEALRKQLAEVLPRPQGLTGPLEFSDEEDNEQNTILFEKCVSPLEGMATLQEIDSSAQGTTEQKEVIINYKRSLSPIVEESEEETCKTFVLNETKCLDTTSTECIEAIMGVTKTLMASNDTLFNFEDTLGDKEDIFSPRASTQNDSQETTPIKCSNSKISCVAGNNYNVLAAAHTATDRTESHYADITKKIIQRISQQRMPPQTLDFNDMIIESKPETDFCSPDQPKTFSEGTSSPTTDRLSSSLSPTLDNEATFTLNTMYDKTCVAVIINDAERTPELEWVITTKSLYHAGSTDNLTFDENSYEKKSEILVKESDSITNPKISNDIICIDNKKKQNYIQRKNSETYHEIDSSALNERCAGIDSFPSAEISNIRDKKDSTNNYSAMPLEDSCTAFHQNSSKQVFDNIQELKDEKFQCFYEKETQLSYNHKNLNGPGNNDGTIEIYESEKEKLKNNKILESFKENSDPNINIKCQVPNISDRRNHSDENIKYQKLVGFNNHEKNNLKSCKDNISSSSTGDDNFNIDQQNEIYIYAKSLNDLRFTGAKSDKKNHIPFDNYNLTEWESDVDDSHSSEEFVFIPGKSNEDILRSIEKGIYDLSSEQNNVGNDEGVTIKTQSISNQRVSVINGEAGHTPSFSEFEGEFVLSCWDHIAAPTRSTLKSPDKSDSSCEQDSQVENKKNLNIVLKKQCNHAVYEYPCEHLELPPTRSEPNLWSIKKLDYKNCTVENTIEEFHEGFAVSSSSARPFHGSQVNFICSTWPNDSDLSWSKIQSQENFNEPKHIATYSDLKWSHLLEMDNIKSNGDNKVEEACRSDSGVGESAEMLSERQLLGDCCNVKEACSIEAIVYPVQCYDSMESISNSTSINYEKQSEHLDQLQLQKHKLKFSAVSTARFSNEELQNQNIHQISGTDQPELFEEKKINKIHLGSKNNLNFTSKSGKFKQSDSTDEDSGIESIMKINRGSY